MCIVAGSHDAAAEPGEGEEVESQGGQAHPAGRPANNCHGAHMVPPRRN